MSRPKLVSQPERPVLPTIKDLEASGFSLDASELTLFDSIAIEQVEKAGTPIMYWHYDRTNTVVDPVYDEPVERKFIGPFRLKGSVDYPDSTPEAREQGLRTQWNCTLWIPRKSLEIQKAPEPNIGDVILLWDTNFFASEGVQDENVPGAKYMFVVTDSDSDGHLFDTPAFTFFKLDLERRTEYTPERFLKSK